MTSSFSVWNKVYILHRHTCIYTKLTHTDRKEKEERKIYFTVYKDRRIQSLRYPFLCLRALFKILHSVFLITTKATISIFFEGIFKRLNVFLYSVIWEKRKARICL